MRKLLLIIAVTGCLGSTVMADVRLPKVFGDHMVLQREKPVNVWGWADAGEVVKVTFGEATASTKADKDGNWSLQLPARKATGTPSEFSVAGNNKIVLSDVLVGEVWLCSGQSNMAGPMKGVQFSAEDIPNAQYPRIRLFSVAAGKASPVPQDDVNATWTACTPQSVSNFSAVAYHFGRTLHEEIKVPIGLICAAWGGTVIAPWIPLEGYEPFESLKQWADSARAFSAQSKVYYQFPTVIYNAMIHPLIPFALRGVIWYQGESDILRNDTTVTLHPSATYTQKRM